jgi:hypothetical protein
VDATDPVRCSTHDPVKTSAAASIAGTPPTVQSIAAAPAPPRAQANPAAESGVITFGNSVHPGLDAW